MTEPKNSQRTVDVDERNMPKHGPVPQQGGSDLPPDADMEERFTEFFRRNGTSLFGAIALAAVVVVGTMTYRHLQERSEIKTQEAFRAAQNDEAALTAFAQDNDDHQLGAIANFQLANLQYGKGEYRQALEHYQIAAEELTQAPYAERARMGMAMAQLQLGESENAIAMLQQIANTQGYLDTTRGEAAYHMAVYYWQNKDAEGMQSALDLLSGIEGAGMWAMRGDTLAEQLELLRGE